MLSKVLPDLNAKKDNQEPGLQMKIYYRVFYKTLASSSHPQYTRPREHTLPGTTAQHTPSRQIITLRSTAHESHYTRIFQIACSWGHLTKCFRQKFYIIGFNLKQKSQKWIEHIQNSKMAKFEAPGINEYVYTTVRIFGKSRGYLKYGK